MVELNRNSLEEIVELRPYGPTAGRKNSDKKVNYTSNKTIDAHCHLHVQEAADLVSDLFDPMQVPAFKTTNEVTSKQNQQQAKDRALHLTDLGYKTVSDKISSLVK